ncbi:MAG: hypothetical protein GEV11_06400 [Streptosporangiales bacterium]|nr:hypothetical protein [Streptosporangiales bacterium]
MAMWKSRRRRGMSDGRMSRAQERARIAAEHLGPYAEQARDTASVRLLQARAWTAPRLIRAGKTLEGSIAPRVSAAMSAAAHRIQPPRRRRFGRASVVMLLVGVAGAVGAVGVARRMRTAQSMPSGTEAGTAERETAEAGAEETEKMHTV